MGGNIGSWKRRQREVPRKAYGEEEGVHQDHAGTRHVPSNPKLGIGRDDSARLTPLKLTTVSLCRRSCASDLECVPPSFPPGVSNGLSSFHGKLHEMVVQAQIQFLRPPILNLGRLLQNQSSHRKHLSKAFFAW